MNRTTIDTMIKMVLDRWHGAVKNFDGLLNALPDEALDREVAPGKNRGIYLLGHLIAVHDDMLVLLALGEHRFPELRKPFLELPDKAVAELPSAAQLRSYWTGQCAQLAEHFQKMAPKAWFERHTAVSEEDFSKEPHRAKLNILITRTTHLTYHTGQMVLLK